ncbi:UbiA prenyltransferase [Penicillium pulvis]|uniref:UbiA prenyltransferase n=1 Tax=Penicillium pulvis TaxID=1562058 RepID=UPI00254843A7|nr:UbiA prenyltransferase [Penicillium pulvis]KAJ5792470.1 UbiA prenyltransferase [Penicillium pulvis]
MATTTEPSTSNRVYSPSGILASLPPALVPYAELIRLSKPTGVLNITLPYIFGALYSALAQPVDVSFLLQRITQLLVAGFILRGLGCSWNDIIDRNIDRQVARTRHRPMAREAISVQAALLFTVGQYIVWLSMVSVLVPNHWGYTIPLTGMVIFYPFAKRVTYHAQVILGITLALGVPIGASAMGMDPFRSTSTMLSLPIQHDYQLGIASLFVIYVLWSVVHDTIYAQQDIQDDLKAGVYSMAVYYRNHLKLMLGGVSVIMVLLQIYAGVALNAHLAYQVIASFGSAVVVAAMLRAVDIESSDECEWWFRNGSLAWGVAVTAGLCADIMCREVLVIQLVS